MILFCICAASCRADYAELSADDVQRRTNEILALHGFRKELNPELVRQIMNEYVNGIDPEKERLSSSLRKNWTEPSDAFVLDIQAKMKQGNYAPFIEIYKQAWSGSGQEIQNKSLTQVLKSLGKALDPHTRYYTPNEANLLYNLMQQQFYGIGVALKVDEGSFYVRDLIEGGPAAKSGQLMIGDQVMAVDGVSLDGMEMLEASSLIKGNKGSQVKLDVKRDSFFGSKTFTLTLNRDTIILDQGRIQSSVIPYQDGIIGHIKVNTMYKDSKTNTSLDVSRIINKWKKENNLKGVILDLRSNPGGYMPEAIQTAGLFIKKGIIATMVDSSGKETHLRDISPKPPIWYGPLIILVDKKTGSAAEIITGTLQDYERAIVVGDSHTYGKGTYQTLRSKKRGEVLEDPKGSFKVTRGYYFTVLGRSPQVEGITPDIVVPGPLSESEIGERYLENALPPRYLHPHYSDTLEDMPPIKKNKMEEVCLKGVEKINCISGEYMDWLQTSSQKRIESNKQYQNYLESLKEKPVDPPKDFQLEETVNIMKDMIELEEFRTDKDNWKW